MTLCRLFKSASSDYCATNGSFRSQAGFVPEKSQRNVEVGNSKCSEKQSKRETGEKNQKLENVLWNGHAIFIFPLFWNFWNSPESTYEHCWHFQTHHVPGIRKRHESRGS